MSKTVDERVVSMQFDNRTFEDNVSQSLSTIDKLKNSLKFTNATKGLENIDDASKKVNMSPLSSAVESIGVKFSAMQVMAVTALSNITNQAVNAGKRIVSALTIDPVKSGLQEYETQINAVQTILANTQSKGTTLDQVNAALDELNLYADQTIYNFTEMTRNIGTFTAAGVDLDTSVAAIKGIANLAAVSGSTSQQASTAMYQLSQALASGTVKLMDWNSVVNAGMGGQVFQDALKETARVHGIAIDEMITENGSFRETLQEGWLTSQILTETLQKFTGDLSEEQLKSMGYTEKQIEEILKLGQTANDAATKVKTFTQLIDTLKESLQSGWSQTWRTIIGDFEEAKALWTSVSDTLSGIINSSSEARNAMLKGWAEGGGRTMLIESLSNAFQGLVSVVTPIKEAFREIFPRTTSEQLLKITEAIRDFTAKLKLSESAQAKLKSAFKGLFSVIDIGLTILKEVISGLARIVGVFTSLGSGILNVSGSFGDWVSKLRDSIKESGFFALVIDKIVGTLQKFVDAIKSVASIIGQKIAAPGFEVFLKLVEGLWNIVKTIGGKIIEVISAIGSSLGNALTGADTDTLFGVLNGGLLATILLNLRNFVKGFAESFDFVGGITEKIGGILDSVRGAFESYQQNLQADTLFKIASAIAILAAAILVIASIDANRLAAALTSITVLFINLTASLAIFSKIGKIQGIVASSIGMVGVASAILVLAGALKLISTIDPKSMVSGVLGITALTAVVVAAASALSKQGKVVIKGALGLIAFAGAVKILASATKDIADLSWEGLLKGLLGVTVLITAVSLFLSNTKFSAKSVSSATGMVILAAAIKILASASEDFSKLSWDGIGKALTSISALLASLAIFSKLTSGTKNVLSTSIALTIIAASMKIFASAMYDFSSLSWENISKGILSIAGALLAIAIAVNLMPKNLVGIGLGLIAVSGALTIITNSFTKLGDMSWEEVSRGLVALAGSLSILAIALISMKSTLAGSASLIVASAAIGLLTPSLKSLGKMSWESIAKGLVTLAGAFTIIGIAGAVLGPLTPVILTLSAGIALLGVGLLAAGVGITTFSAGITALAAALSVGALTIVKGITAIIVAIIDLIPDIAVALGKGIIAIAEVLTDGIKSIGELLKVLVITLVDVLVETAPKIADGALQLIVKVLESLVKYTPQIVEHLFDFLIGLLEGIAEKIPELVVAAVKVMMSFFEGIISALGQIDTDTLLKSIAGIGLIAGLLVALGALASLVPAAMVGVLGMGAVIAELAIVLAAVGALAQIPGLQWLISEGGNLLQSVGNAIGKFLGGILGGVAEGITSSLPKIGTDLSSFMRNATPFIEGARMVDETTLSGVKTLVDMILVLTAANILDGIAKFITGSSSLTKFAEEIVPFGRAITEFSGIISGNINEEAILAAANAGKIMSDMANTIPRSGGIFQFFAGEKNLETFSSQLVLFGRAITDFSTVVSGNINEEAILAAANAGSMMADMNTTIPSSGGIVEWFAGQKSLETFGKQILSFGDAMANYSATVSGKIDEGAVTASANAGRALAEMNAALPKTGGLGALFVGDENLGNFSKGIVKVGEAMVDFSKAVSGKINEGAVTAAANAGKAIAELSSINSSGLSSAVNSVNKIVDLAKGVEKIDFNGLTSLGESLEKVAKNGVDLFINTFKDSYEKAEKACFELVKYSVPDKDDHYKDWYNLGKYLVDGFKNGIGDSTYSAEVKAREMARAARIAAEQALGVNSPSKVFYKIGSFTGDGFINALSDYATKSYSAGSDLAVSAKNGLSKALSKTANIMVGDFDLNPTIRPVLDLSDIESGASDINRMFGMRPSVDVMGNIGSIDRMMNERQNGSDQEIVSAIKGLERRLSESSSNVYNINGITYDDGSNISRTVEELLRAARVERRI